MFPFEAFLSLKHIYFTSRGETGQISQPPLPAEKNGRAGQEEDFFFLFILPTGQRSLAPKFWNSLDVRRRAWRISLVQRVAGGMDSR
jgi:hypothetical protein